MPFSLSDFLAGPTASLDKGTVAATTYTFSVAGNILSDTVTVRIDAMPIYAVCPYPVPGTMGVGKVAGSTYRRPAALPRRHDLEACAAATEASALVNGPSKSFGFGSPIAYSTCGVGAFSSSGASSFVGDQRLHISLSAPAGFLDSLGCGGRFNGAHDATADDYGPVVGAWSDVCALPVVSDEPLLGSSGGRIFLINNQGSAGATFPAGSRSLGGLPSTSATGSRRMQDDVLGDVFLQGAPPFNSILIIPDGAAGEVVETPAPPEYADGTYNYDLYLPGATVTGVAFGDFPARFVFFPLFAWVNVVSAIYSVTITGNNGATVVRTGAVTLIDYHNAGAGETYKYVKEQIAFTLPDYTEFGDGSQWASVGQLKIQGTWSSYYLSAEELPPWPLLVGSVPVWRPRCPISLPGGDWYSPGFIPP